jgi:hypothetical protein
MIKQPKCHNCNEIGKYSELFDAYFCKKCGIWLEKNCGDPKCLFCLNRPNKPSEIEMSKEEILRELTEEAQNLGLYE